MRAAGSGMGDPGAERGRGRDPGGVLRGLDATGPGATGMVGVSVPGGSVPWVFRARSVALAVGRGWARRPCRTGDPAPVAEGTAAAAVSLVGPRSGRPASLGAAPSLVCSRSRLGNLCVGEVAFVS